MRFGQTLRNSVYPPWKDKYLDYDKVKKLLREDEVSPQGRAGGNSNWSERDEENFVHELVTVQLEKVNKHQAETATAIRDRTSAAESKLQQTTDGSAKSDNEKKEVAQETLKELDSISKEITELRKFSRVNYTGFLKAAKKHDRRRGQKYRVRPILQVRMAETPFNSEDYQPLLFRLSTMYTWARQVLEGENADQAPSQTSVRPQDKYTAYKFWVHADNLLEVKTYILRRLPVLVYNPQSLKVVDSSQKDPTITSIYFDNDQFQLYQGKVEKTEEAGSLRLRWSGQLEDKPEIVLEKKMVSETTGSRDIRVTLKQKYIQPFLKGEYKMEKQIAKLEGRLGADSSEVKDLKSNVEEIQNFIKEKNLEPVLRASYTRTAFQIPGDDRIRVSLDTDLALIREDALDTDRPCRDPEDWHRSDIDDRQLEYPYSSIKKGEIDRFPHAVLEIKVKDSKYTRNNAWLADLMSSHLVKESPKFSKFVHGVAELFEDYVNSFPFWLSDLETDIRRDPETAFVEEQERQDKQAADEVAVGSFISKSMLSPSGRAGQLGTPSARFGSPSARIGSPSAKVGSPLAQRGSISRAMSVSVPKATNQLESTVEEHDSDDDGVQGTSTNNQATGLTSFLPFSNSRYARRHRQQGRGWEDAPLPPGVEKPDFWIKDQGPLKVEAKVWLANQRTFVKWQHIAVLLATLSLGLYNAAGVDNNVARILSLVYTAFAVFAAVWGWGVYMWRSNLITERSGKDFDNMVGPFVVSLGLAAALVLNFAFKYSAAVSRHDEGQRNSTMVFEPLVLQHEGL
jgi:SPX domain protein involved in polyphosphate accumulation